MQDLEAEHSRVIFHDPPSRPRFNICGMVAGKGREGSITSGRRNDPHSDETGAFTDQTGVCFLIRFVGWARPCCP